MSLCKNNITTKLPESLLLTQEGAVDVLTDMLTTMLYKVVVFEHIRQLHIFIIGVFKKCQSQPSSQLQHNL